MRHFLLRGGPVTFGPKRTSTKAPRALLKTKGPASAGPISSRLDAGVDCYFLAFLAFFFFTIGSSFCSDIGKTEVCLSR
jgi:hypothetical protein